MGMIIFESAGGGGGEGGGGGGDGVGLLWKGVWDSGTDYVVNDVVTNDGVTYVCTQAHTNQEPPNGSYWDVLAEGDSGGDGVGLLWQGAWGNSTAYDVNDVVTNDGVTYVCTQGHTNQEPPNASYWDVLAEGGDGVGISNVVEDTSPQLGGDLDCQSNTVHFGTAENVATPTGTEDDINLGAGNHQTLDVGSATGAVTVTFIAPPGPSAGTLLVKQGSSARDITWQIGVPKSIKWLGTEPTWNADTNMWRLVAWRYDGNILFLQASEAAAV